MLVLSRKLGERICLQLPGGEEVWLTVLTINYRQAQIRLGIDAPRSVVIHREENLRGKEAPSCPTP